MGKKGIKLLRTSLMKKVIIHTVCIWYLMDFVFACGFGMGPKFWCGWWSGLVWGWGGRREGGRCFVLYYTMFLMAPLWTGYRRWNRMQQLALWRGLICVWAFAAMDWRERAGFWAWASHLGEKKNRIRFGPKVRCQLRRWQPWGLRKPWVLKRRSKLCLQSPMNFVTPLFLALGFAPRSVAWKGYEMTKNSNFFL